MFCIHHKSFESAVIVACRRYEFFCTKLSFNFIHELIIWKIQNNYVPKVRKKLGKAWLERKWWQRSDDDNDDDNNDGDDQVIWLSDSDNNYSDSDEDYQATRLIRGEEDVASRGTIRLKIILWQIFNRLENATRWIGKRWLRSHKEMLVFPPAKPSRSCK